MSLIESRSISVINLHNGKGSASDESDVNLTCGLDVDMEEVHEIIDNSKQKFKCLNIIRKENVSKNY